MTTKNFTWVFGLTADPIHRGHEQVIINTLEVAKNNYLSSEQVLLMPTYQPNLIDDKKAPQADFKDRLKMCSLTAEDLQSKIATTITVSDIEKTLYQKQQQPSFTYESLDALSSDYENLMLIISSDHAHGHAPKFRKWHRWDELISRFGLIIHERPGYPLNDCFVSYLKELNPAADVYVAKNQPSIEVSSSQIRNAYNYGAEPTDAQINPVVAEYIQSLGLYQ